MLARAFEVCRRIWRGAWRPLYPLAAQPKWYHYVEYWLWRPRDYVVGSFIFLIPLAIGYLLYVEGSIHPILLSIQLAIWAIAVIIAHSNGAEVKAPK